MTARASTPMSALPQRTRLWLPDTARGIMLLLVALANVPLWQREDASLQQGSHADVWWSLFRTMFVDGRAYPLFALLFGYGLGVLITRAADDDASGVLRRRGVALLLFGALHAVVFPYDILGIYGLCAVVFAGLFVRAVARSRRRMVVLLIIGIFVSSFVLSWWSAPSRMTSMVFGQPIEHLGFWFLNTVSSGLLSLVVPAMCCGVLLSQASFWASPERFQQRFAWMVSGVFLGGVCSLPFALSSLGILEHHGFYGVLHHLGTVFGTIGFFGVLGVLATSVRIQSSWWGRSVRALGQASLTGYVTQTVVFFGVFSMVGQLGALASGVLAIAAWLFTVMCAGVSQYRVVQQTWLRPVLHRPADRLLRYVAMRL